MTTLAQELVDAIVDQIDGWDALKLCSLTARAFVAPCQGRLFKSIDITSQPEKGRRACLIFSTPHLQPYVREIFIVGQPCCAVDSSDRQLVREQLLPLIPGLQNVVRVTIASVSWPNPPEADLVTAILSLSSLQGLQFSDALGVPVELLIRAASSLRALNLASTCINNTTYEGAETVSPSASRLEALQIYYPPIGETLDIHPAFLQHLQGLRLLEVSPIEPGTVQGLRELAYTARHTLQMLVFEYLQLSRHIGPIELPRLELLRCAEISLFIFRGESYTLQSALDLLPDIKSSMPALELLTLEIKPVHQLSLRSDVLDFDDTLMSLEHLLDVDFRVDVRGPMFTDQAHSALISSIRAQLPKANEADLLVFS